MPRHKAKATTAGQAFWKIAGAGAAFQAGSSAVDSATIVASLVHKMTGLLIVDRHFGKGVLVDDK